jgi:hypothetical protein
MKTTKLSLSVDALDSKPIDFDWTSNPLADISEEPGTPWDFWEAVECPKCKRIVVAHAGMTECPGASEEEDDEGNAGEDCGEEISAEGPMMNYWYPCDIRDPEEAARTIADLPLCVVQVGDDYGLALTGGGMDLSWAICEAFVLLGFYPPTHFADLPRMAGPVSKGMRSVVEAMTEGLKIRKGWIDRDIKRMPELSAWLDEQEARYAKPAKR